MKILAAATICLTIPTVFTSFFGQNCPMPWDVEFASNPWAFITLTLVSIVSIAISFFIMKKKKMF